ncbi:MAG TPA: hypothetical protein VE955_02090, partial [Candidatus Dormibacteraeota bacterium]|nr:hypothetical protein [Candidatus Dormibacteraeota bacterium]
PFLPILDSVKRHRKLVGVSVFMVALLILVVVLLVSCPDIKVLDSGTNIALQPGQHAQYPFNLDGTHELFGAFAASSQVTLYLMTTNQFTAFNNTGSASSYIYTTGSVLSFDFTSLGKNCGKGCTAYQAYQFSGTNFVVFSDSSQSQATISIQKPFLVETC